jgi:hypothetical protein
MTVADDFDALRTIRAPLGELDPERAARMRARALAGVLGDAAPGRTATAVAERPDHLVVVPDLPAVEIHLDTPDHPRHERTGAAAGRRTLVVAAAAAVVVVLFVAIGALRGGGERTAVVADQPDPAAIADLVANARAVPDRPLPAELYAHLVVEDGRPVSDVDGATETHAQTRETWTNPAGAGRDVLSDEVVLDDDGRPTATFSPGFEVDGASGEAIYAPFGYDGLRALPTDPVALDGVLRDDRFGSDAATRMRVLRQLLQFDATPPQVRAAALQLLADEGATFVGAATDRSGQAGFGIRLVRADGLTTTFVTTRDGLLLGSYDVVTGVDPVPANAVSWSTVVERDRVATVG